MSIGYGQEEDTLFKNLKVQRDASGDILLAPLLESVRSNGIDVNNSSVTYWDAVNKTYVFVGKYPVAPDSKIPE